MCDYDLELLRYLREQSSFPRAHFTLLDDRPYDGHAEPLVLRSRITRRIFVEKERDQE